MKCPRCLRELPEACFWGNEECQDCIEEIDRINWYLKGGYELSWHGTIDFTKIERTYKFKTEHKVNRGKSYADYLKEAAIRELAKNDPWEAIKQKFKNNACQK